MKWTMQEVSLVLCPDPPIPPCVKGSDQKGCTCLRVEDHSRPIRLQKHGLVTVFESSSKLLLAIVLGTCRCVHVHMNTFLKHMEEQPF